MPGTARQRSSSREVRLLLSRATFVLAGALFLSLALAACSDGNEPAPLPPAATPTAEEESVLPLERFHYVASLTLREVPPGDADEVVVSTEGDFQAPDRHALTYSIQRGDAAVSKSAVLVGERAWFREQDAPWQATTPDDPAVAELLSVAFSGVRPGLLGGT